MEGRRGFCGVLCTSSRRHRLPHLSRAPLVACKLSLDLHGLASSRHSSKCLTGADITRGICSLFRDKQIFSANSGSHVKALSARDTCSTTLEQETETGFSKVEPGLELINYICSVPSCSWHKGCSPWPKSSVDCRTSVSPQRLLSGLKCRSEKK